MTTPTPDSDDTLIPEWATIRQAIAANADEVLNVVTNTIAKMRALPEWDNDDIDQALSGLLEISSERWGLPGGTVEDDAETEANDDFYRRAAGWTAQDYDNWQIPFCRGCNRSEAVCTQNPCPLGLMETAHGLR